MKLARAIHFDESDTRVFAAHARTGEWCVPGGFEFSDWTEGDLTGKARQAFANGWLGVETGGRVSFVAVAPATEAERAAVADHLAAMFRRLYGAPSHEAAHAEAERQVADMADLCAAHAPNTLLTVSRELSADGVRETFGAISPQDAGLDQFAIHGSLDE